MYKSEATQSRAKNAGVDLLPSDERLVLEADYILSIVPPRDAKATADRIIRNISIRADTDRPLYYLDLNAIAPSTARSIASQFDASGGDVRVLDGGIIGGPPKPGSEKTEEWYRPSICLSGPWTLEAGLASVLNTKHVGPEIGTASGLKCCFASLTKGYTALAIQSFSTAHQLGVLPALEEYITAHGGKPRLEMQQKSLVSMPPKAGRWVEEMREINKTFNEDGGWEAENVFEAIAGIYDFVAEGSVLGKEHVDKRVRGTTARDVVDALGEGLEARRQRRKSV